MWDYVKNTKKPIILYGMGNGAEKILNELERRSINRIAGIFASPGFLRNHQFHGFDIVSYEDIKKKFGDVLILLSFGTHLPDVIEYIKSISKEQELLAPDVPVYGNEIFDKEFYNNHLNEIKQAYNMISEPFSKKVFNNIIDYKLSGKIDFLLSCETEKDEIYKNILKLNNEIYMDLGAYKGDTIDEFIKYTNGYEKIIAVEPDVKNFKRLIKNIDGLSNICCYNSPINDKDEKILFNSFGGRNSFAGGDNGSLAQGRSVDSLLNGEKVTYIKMDVEGQEEKAIIGAKETIKKYKPKMLISCYHKSEDIFKIPIIISSIRNDYNIYLRHHPSLPAWDTNYFFV